MPRSLFSLPVLLVGLLLMLSGGPAMAVNKTVNGITVDTTLPQAQRGVPYSFQLSPTGPSPYVGPYQFSALASNLPAGLYLSRSGLVEGVTCSANGNYADTSIRIGTTAATPNVTADFTGGTSFAINVTTAPSGSCSLTLAGSVPATGTVGSAYSGQVTASGGTAPYSFTRVSGALPAGVTLGADGSITGTPTVAGTYLFSLLATDSTGLQTGALSYTVTISEPSGIQISPSTLPAATSGTAYSQQVQATGGLAPYAFTVSAGSLPPGLVLGPDGNLEGTPSAPGTYTFTLFVQDANGETATREYTFLVEAAERLAISPDNLPGGTSGTAYDQALTATGGVAPYTFTVSAGALPGGLGLAADGSLSGTPTAAGSYTFTVYAEDANGDFGSREYTLVIAAGDILSLAPTTLPGGTSGTPYSQVITPSGGVAPYTCAVSAGALPAGLTLADDGTLSGTTSAGSYTFTITCTDANGDFGSREYTLDVAAADVLQVSPATLPGGTSGAAYDQAITAAGGVAPYTFTVSAGALPGGLGLAADGSLSGTPTAAGSYTFTVYAEDANGDFGLREYTLVIAGGDILSLAPASLPGGTSGTPYSQVITPSGGVAPYSCAVSAGALPTGLTLADDGTLSGTTSAGSYTFTITCTDANGDFGSREYTLDVAVADVLQVSPATLPGGTSGAAYDQAITATGGVAPYTFTVSAGALPGGLALAADGTLSGTPTAAGSYTFTVYAEDANGDFGSREYTLVIAPGELLAVNPATLPGGTSGASYVQSISATGGVGPYTFTVSAGALPDGLRLAAGGSLSGTPAAAGTYTFTVYAEDANGDFGSREYTVAIAGGDILSIAPANLPGGRSGEPYRQTLTPSGGVAPYTCVVSAGALPAGLSLSANGTLSGTTSAGSYTFTITCTDANGDFGSREYTLEIGTNDLLTVNPASLPGGSSGTAYRQSVSATGGVAPYAYSISAGALPGGLALAADGTLSGTPTAAGSYTFTVHAEDANGDFGSRQYTLVIAPGNVVAITPATLPDASGGARYDQRLDSSGGVAPYTYTVSAGALPPGVSLASDGTLSGTATTPGTYTFTIRVTDANGDFGEASYTIVVAAADAGLAWIGPVSKTMGEAAFDLPDPTSASTAAFTFTSSDPSIASVSGRKVTLVRPGTVTLTVRQAAQGIYAAASASTTLSVGERPDPTRDPGVVSSLAAQADAAVRFAGAQQQNVRERLRQVRHGANASQHGASASLSQGGGESLSVGLSGAGDKALPALPEGWGLWTAGSLVTSGRDGASGFDAQTDGLTLGLDRRIGEHALLGVAAGLGWNGNEFDDRRSRVEATQRALAAYGLWRVGDAVFLDGSLGWGELDFSLRRFSAPANAVARADRKGEQWFGSLMLGHEASLGPFSLTSYGRLDATRSVLDAYRESGAGIYDLAVGRQVVETRGIAAGIEGSRAWETSSGTLRPHWMLEYRSALENRSDVALNYVSAPLATDFGLRLRPHAGDGLAWGLGLDADITRDWRLSVLYRGEHGSGMEVTSHGLSILLSWQFGGGAAAVPATNND